MKKKHEFQNLSVNIETGLLRDLLSLAVLDRTTPYKELGLAINLYAHIRRLMMSGETVWMKPSDTPAYQLDMNEWLKDNLEGENDHGEGSV